jgi:hypothetical protein
MPFVKPSDQAAACDGDGRKGLSIMSASDLSRMKNGDTGIRRDD